MSSDPVLDYGTAVELIGLALRRSSFANAICGRLSRPQCPAARVEPPFFRHRMSATVWTEPLRKVPVEKEVRCADIELPSEVRPRSSRGWCRYLFDDTDVCPCE